MSQPSDLGHSESGVRADLAASGTAAEAFIPLARRDASRVEALIANAKSQMGAIGARAFGEHPSDAAVNAHDLSCAVGAIVDALAAVAVAVDHKDPLEER